MKKTNLSPILSSFFAAFLLFSCATTSIKPGTAANKKSGTDYIVEEIDLTDDSLEITTYPGKKGFVKPLEVSRFARKKRMLCRNQRKSLYPEKQVKSIFRRKRNRTLC